MSKLLIIQNVYNRCARHETVYYIMAKASFKKVRSISLVALLLAILGISCGNAQKTKEVAKADNTQTEQAKPISEEDMVQAALEHLLHDVAQQKMEQFHWFSKDDILKMSGGKVEKYERGDIREVIVNHPEEWKKEINRLLAQIKGEGEERDFDFNNYTFESLKTESKIDEMTKGKVYRGRAILKCGDKHFDLVFKNLVFLDEDAKYVDGLGIGLPGEYD